jgi:hypothetical protein
MARKKLLGTQVKRLLSGVSDHGARHLTEIETDLVQTSVLLGEAIEKLGASFMAIHGAVEAQQKAVDSLLVGVNLDIAEELKARQSQISQHVNAAVTGLQFEDMTNQLIGRTLKRVSGLRDVLGAMESGSAGLSAEGDTEEIIAALITINTALEKRSAQLESALWKAVCQTHMESGDVELF